MNADALDLIGPDEIAARLGTRGNTVASWRARPWCRFPAPLATVSRVPLWHWATVRAWADATGRLPERYAADMSDDAAPTISAADRAEAVAAGERAWLTLDTIGQLAAIPPRTALRTGEWDWSRDLSRAERKRIARRWTSPDGVPVDTFAEALAPLVGDAITATDDLERVMLEWLRLTRQADASGAIKMGREISLRAYGGLQLRDLFGLESERVEEIAPLVVRYGPHPIELEWEEWRDEVLDLRATASAIDLGAEWLAPTDVITLGRLEELAPSRILEMISADDLEGAYVAMITAYLAQAV